MIELKFPMARKDVLDIFAEAVGRSNCSVFIDQTEDGGRDITFRHAAALDVVVLDGVLAISLRGEDGKKVELWLNQEHAVKAFERALAPSGE